MTTVAAQRIPRAHARSRSEHAEANRTLWVAASATLLVLAVFSAVVTTVGDSLQTLHGDVSSQTWTLSGMSLGLAVALLTVGALADAFGRRRVLVVSSALLALTSALGAVAPSMNVLIAARILQGVAGAGIIAAALGAIGHAFPTGHRRAHATSVWGSAVGAGIAIGPLAGGALAGFARLAEQLLARGDRGRRAGPCGCGNRGVARGHPALAGSLRRVRAGPRDGGSHDRPDRGSAELVGGHDDRSPRRRGGLPRRVRGDRVAQARADTRARPVLEPPVRWHR